MNNNEFTRRRAPNKTVTVAAWGENEEPPVSVSELRQALGITTRHTINEHLKALGLFGKKYLTWEEAKHVIGMHCWVQIKLGDKKFSKKKYAALHDKSLAEYALKTIGKIDLEKEVQQVKNHARHQHRSAS